METLDLPVEPETTTTTPKKRKQRSDEGQMLVRKISRLRKNRDRLRRLADDARKRFQRADDALRDIQAACSTPDADATE